MSTASLSVFRGYELAWTLSAEQERRYRRIQLRTLIAVLLLALLMHFLPVQDIIRTEMAPPPLPVEVLLPRKPPATPAPPPPAPVAKPQALTPMPVPAAKLPPPKPMPDKPQPVHQDSSGSPAPAPKPSARERAAAAGINDLANDLASLRDSAVVSKAITGRPDMKGPPNPNFTSDLNGGQSSGPGSERSLITARAGQSSGGINTAGMSRGFGGGGLAGRGTTLVAGYGVGGNGKGGGGGNGNGRGNGVGNGSGDGSGTGSGAGASRSREEVEIVFDQNKGAIFALYNRALRENPGLRGQIVLRLTILPDGTVSACELVSSELNAPEFEQRLVQRVKLFKFEAKAVATLVATKPLKLFPQD